MKKKSIVICLAVIMAMVFSANVVIAKEKKQIKWKMTTCWKPIYLLIEADKYFVNLVNEMSAGELKIEFYEGGTLVPTKQVFDAVKGGLVQISGDFAGYWAGKDTAFNLLGSYPMGLNAINYVNWIYQAGGLELFQEVYGKYGVIYFPHAVTTQESGPRGTKAIKSLDDYKGLKIRMSGKVQGNILKELSAAQVKISSSEVYQAMQKGVIDAAESSSPFLDWALKYGEITTFSSHPGWHQPGGTLGLIINKKAWESLPKHLQAIIRVAAQATVTWWMSYQDYTSSTGTELFEEKGIKEYHLSDEDLTKLAELSNKYTYEMCAENPLFAKVAYSQFKYMHKMKNWLKLSAPLRGGWADQPLPDLEKIKTYVK